VAITKPKNIKEYYAYYLTLHQHPKCKLLHFLGQWLTLFFVFFAISNKFWVLLFVVPFVIYPFAWSGHYFFEKNTPAAFNDPIKAKISDWLMFKDILLGRLRIW
tara:strand:+ start:730 stop:1041 length:312 start_codon:yes stop_codon:yes gene_type:complete